MKKSLFFLFVLIICISCSQNQSSNKEQNEIIQEEYVEIAIDETQNFDEIGFELMESETIGQLQFDMSLEAIEKEVGEPEEKTEFEFWGADGFEHQTRIYQNNTLDIDFIKTEDGEIVCNMITIYGASDLKTSRNIGIGDSRNAVLKAYQAEIYDRENKEALIAGTIYGGVIFTFENDKVKSIFVGAGAE
jgi:hypothetical protein